MAHGGTTQGNIPSTTLPRTGRLHRRKAVAGRNGGSFNDRRHIADTARMFLTMPSTTGKLKVYCETSFWSYLVGGRTTDAKIAADQAMTQKWWEEIAPHCETYISQYVVAEAGRGNPEMAVARKSAMRNAIAINSRVRDVDPVAEKLMQGHAVPATEGTDALHIATASVYGMDVLLTWNCKHMANPVTLPRTVSIIAKIGYDCPIIITPTEFVARKEEFCL